MYIYAHRYVHTHTHTRIRTYQASNDRKGGAMFQITSSNGARHQRPPTHWIYIVVGKLHNSDVNALIPWYKLWVHVGSVLWSTEPGDYNDESLSVISIPSNSISAIAIQSNSEQLDKCRHQQTPRSRSGDKWRCLHCAVHNTTGNTRQWVTLSHA